MPDSRQFLLDAIHLESEKLPALRGDGDLELERTQRIIAALKNCLTLLESISQDIDTLIQMRQPNMVVRE